MKTINSCLLILVISFLLNGCGNGQTSASLEPVPTMEVSSLEPILTITPTETFVQGFLNSDKCKRFGETMGSIFIHTYEGKGCKLILLSPDSKYLAYVTLSLQSASEGNFFSDAVKVIDFTDNNLEKEIYASSIKLAFVEKLEWGSNGELIIWENTWEGGNWILYVYEPDSGQLLARMITDDLSLQWNNQHNAFYVVGSDSYGKEMCISKLYGYDFAADINFPDIKEILWPQQQSENPPDELHIDPFAWSEDGKRLWLTVTPLRIGEKDPYRYELGPKQAVVMEFSENGINVNELASDPALDFSFMEPDNPEVISSPYQLEYCPSDN